MTEMNHLLSRRLLAGIVVTAAIISQVINAKKANVTTQGNKCKDGDAVKEVNITFTPSHPTDCKYSFGCGKHEPDYPPCPPSPQKPQSVMSVEHMNDTCASSYGGSGRLARSAKDGRCYRVCDSCNREIVNGNETIPDAETAKSHTADKSQSRKTCIEEKHTVEFLLEDSKKNVSNEGCNWKYKCKKKENSTNYVEKAVGMRLRPSNGSRIRVQLYCCKMNCSYNCTRQKFASLGNETIMSKLNESEVFTRIQVQNYREKDGLLMHTVALTKCRECLPGLPPAKQTPPAIPVPVLVIGYDDDPNPRKYNRCFNKPGECKEDEKCFLYCLPLCTSDSDCPYPAGNCNDYFGQFQACNCRVSTNSCSRPEQCCSGKCNTKGKCEQGDSSCIYDMNCNGATDKNGNKVRTGICTGGQCEEKK